MKVGGLLFGLIRITECSRSDLFALRPPIFRLKLLVLSTFKLNEGWEFGYSPTYELNSDPVHVRTKPLQPDGLTVDQTEKGIRKPEL